jgi:hypothetical protein
MTYLMPLIAAIRPQAGLSNCPKWFQVFDEKFESSVKTLKILIAIVLAPRSIHNITITPNSTSALINWDMDEGPMLKIDLE